MEHRHPSVSLCPTTNGVVSYVRRRCSGNRNLSPEGHLCNKNIPHRESTVRLADSASLSPPVPSLPLFSFEKQKDTGQQASRSGVIQDLLQEILDIQRAFDEDTFAAVPLTPRPDSLSREPSNNSAVSDVTRASQISRLPTPDFIARSRSPSTNGKPSMVHPYLSRVFSFTSLPFIESARSFPVEDPSGMKIGSRSRSSKSFQSRDSCRSWRSIDSGRNSLISSIGTTHKFTYKWPRPKVKPSRWDDISREKIAMRTLEDGRGLGLDPINKWTSFKWFLLVSIITVFAYGSCGLVAALTTWFRTWDHADVILVADYDILVLATLCSSILLFTAMVGLTGTLLNSRPILAIYALLLWPSFISILVVGYLGYKRSIYALDRKLGRSWSQYYTPLGRLMIQDSLHCCGFFNPLHEATPSQRCFSRTALPGCKGRLYRFEKQHLDLVWSAAFAIVPVHLINIFVSLLCANHVTKTFGKGIMPQMYRLTEEDVKRDANEIMEKLGFRGVAKPATSQASLRAVLKEDRMGRQGR